MDPEYCRPAIQPPALAPPDLPALHRLIILTCGIHDARGCIERILEPDRQAAKEFHHTRLADVPAANWQFPPEGITCNTCGTSLGATAVQIVDADFCTTCWLKHDEAFRLEHIANGTATLFRLLDPDALALLTNARGIHVCALLARTQYMVQLAELAAATPTGADTAQAVEELEALLVAWSTRTPPVGATAEPLVIHMDEIRASRADATATILGCLASGYPVKVVGLDVDSAMWHPRNVLKGAETVPVIDLSSPAWPVDADAATTPRRGATFADSYDRNLPVKLRDYPDEKTLQSAAPEHNATFIGSMLNLIAPELLNPKGIFNMGRVLTEAVDIVAKYYANGGHHELAFTPVHTDLSEACNVLVHGAHAWWVVIAAWHREAANAILRERYPDSSSDPIGSRVICMTSADIDALRAGGVTVWEVQQSVGEAILVPAECAHQVFNTGANAKIATDTVLMCSAGTLLDRQAAIREKTRVGADTLATSQLVLRALTAALREVCELTGLTEALEEPLIE
jgi:hypothetical protein